MVAAVLGAALMALPACADEPEQLTKREYERLVRSVYAEVQAAFQSTRVPIERLPDRVEAAQDELREAADALDGDEPPAEVEKENDRLVAGMRAYADQLDPVREAAEEGDAAALEELGRTLRESEAVEEMAEAAEQMKFKGYDLGPIADE
jgi:hypothetical protein